MNFFHNYLYISKNNSGRRYAIQYWSIMYRGSEFRGQNKLYKTRLNRIVLKDGYSQNLCKLSQCISGSGKFQGYTGHRSTGCHFLFGLFSFRFVNLICKCNFVSKTPITNQ